MITFDLNVSITMPDIPPLERFDAAARLGFGAVEFWWPDPADLPTVARRVRDAGLRVALFNLDGGNLARGERGLLNDPARVGALRAGLPAALDLAREIGCTRVNALVGRQIPDLSLDEQLDLVRENLAWISAQAAQAGVTVLVESLNTFESPGYLLSSTAAALALIAEVGAPNLAYQYDVYHMQRMEGNICANILANAGRLGHIQVADSPGRNQPGTGELRFPYIFETIAASSYNGYVGLEFVPRGTLADCLAWLPIEQRKNER